jgi:hypothetical protein
VGAEPLKMQIHEILIGLSYMPNMARIHFPTNDQKLHETEKRGEEN